MWFADVIGKCVKQSVKLGEGAPVKKKKRRYVKKRKMKKSFDLNGIHHLENGLLVERLMLRITH